MTTTFRNTSCNSENIVACLVSSKGLLHACISSTILHYDITNSRKVSTENFSELPQSHKCNFLHEQYHYVSENL